jgi:hypothetical protein
VIDGEFELDELDPEEVDPDEFDPDDDELGVVVVVVVAPVPLPEPFEPVAAVPEPACSLATTTPISAVRPVAASTAPRVSVRTRDQARRRSAGVGWEVGGDIVDRRPLLWGRPYLTTCTSTPSQGPLWACCDIVPQCLLWQTSRTDTIARARAGQGARGDECPR